MWFIETCFSKEICNVFGSIHVDINMTIRMSDVCKFDSQEMLNFRVEINIEFITESLFELVFDFRARAEVYEVINEEAEIGRWFSINEAAGEYSRSICTWPETKKYEFLSA